MFRIPACWAKGFGISSGNLMVIVAENFVVRDQSFEASKSRIDPSAGSAKAGV